MTLSNDDKKHLRGIGHKLKPVVTIADKGLTENVLAELNRALNDHELIKVKIRSGDQASRDEMIQTLCKKHFAELIQCTGSIALIYRANHDKKAHKRLRIPSR